MMKKRTLFLCTVLSVVGIQYAAAQGTVDDYKRAFAASSTFGNNKVMGTASGITWNGEKHTFWYQTRTADGQRYVVVDAETKTRTLYNTIEEVRTALNIPDPSQQQQGGFGQWGGSRRGGSTHWAATNAETEGQAVQSPDGKWEAYIEAYNIYVRPVTATERQEGDSPTPRRTNANARRATGQERQLTNDGGLGFYYSTRLTWSPDSRYVSATKIRRAEKHYINFVESSPANSIQPILHTLEYAKPGDALDYREPRIVEVQTSKVIMPSTELFAHQYSLSSPYWSKDGKCVYFNYNERGHKVYRLLELNAETGKVRTVAEDTDEQFVNYNRLWNQFIADGKKLLWASERDNHNHLYLYDVATGTVERQITKGNWYLRRILKVDEENQVIYFTASGMDKQDPYYIHYYRIGLDGKDMTDLTPATGNHSAVFSSDYKYLIDTYSQPDVPPVTVLRDAANGKELLALEKADISQLIAEGWRAPEKFAAPGRDGKTLMYGVIYRPTNFDPSKQYPVVEYIYSGPGDAYAPKTFSAYNGNMTPLAELGFIVVQLDGMGTSYRSKEFEEVCYKNLKDAGLPDRIAWLKAAAKKYPYMDLNNVGIFGASAGGQESTGAVLQYPEFYKAAYSSCGCHDNRMDKIWWNEQWMGYPIDSAYVQSSNVEMAKQLQGALMLVVGELDDNVDPASTMQVVDALIKADKDFELVVLPGEKHTMGGSYGEHKRFDFFVKNLMHKDYPKWSDVK